MPETTFVTFFTLPRDHVSSQAQRIPIFLTCSFPAPRFNPERRFSSQQDDNRSSFFLHQMKTAAQASWQQLLHFTLAAARGKLGPGQGLLAELLALDWGQWLLLSLAWAWPCGKGELRQAGSVSRRTTTAGAALIRQFARTPLTRHVIRHREGKPSPARSNPASCPAVLPARQLLSGAGTPVPEGGAGELGRRRQRPFTRERREHRGAVSTEKVSAEQQLLRL